MTAAADIPFDPPGVSADAFALILQAFVDATDELEQLDDTPIPLPDDVACKLREREALLATMKAAPEAWKPQLRVLYQSHMTEQDLALLLKQREEGAAGSDDVDVPIMPGVMKGLAGVWEELRRAAIVDPAVRAALREVGL